MRLLLLGFALTAIASGVAYLAWQHERIVPRPPMKPWDGRLHWDGETIKQLEAMVNTTPPNWRKGAR